MSKNIIINTNCKNRIKPNLIRDMKTEALLVFARTALERFFEKNKDLAFAKLGTIEETKVVYATLWDLKQKLQDTVVNVDYLINLTKNARTEVGLKNLLKFEEPLITYYDAMAKRIEYHIPKERVFMPELLVLCTLSHWIVEEEKSVSLYPFLKEYDFLYLISRFELTAFESEEDDRKNILDIHKVSTDLIETLLKTKYRYNKNRVSKTRKKK